MKKIDFVKQIMGSVLGKTTTVESNGCGQCYHVTWFEGTKQKFFTLWVDNLRGGRISMKVKCLEKERAERLAKAMWNALYYGDFVVDAASKADVYEHYSPRGGCWYYVARLRCDKVW